jgi:hypothetical protein
LPRGGRSAQPAGLRLYGMAGKSWEFTGEERGWHNFWDHRFIRSALVPGWFFSAPPRALSHLPPLPARLHFPSLPPPLPPQSIGADVGPFFARSATEGGPGPSSHNREEETKTYLQRPCGSPSPSACPLSAPAVVCVCVLSDRRVRTCALVGSHHHPSQGRRGGRLQWRPTVSKRQ